MPAGIEVHEDGRAAFVAVKEHGWHRLGTLVDEDIDINTGLRLALLNDLDYHTEPVLVPCGSPPVMVEAPGSVAVVRRNPFDRETWNVLGVGMSEDYVVHTLEETLAFGSDIIDAGYHLSAIGSIDNGKRAFATFRLDGITIGGVDAVDLYLNLFTSYDRSLATTARCSQIRTVCKNTMDAVLGEKTAPTFRVKHVGEPLKFRVQDAREALEVAWSGADEFAKEAELWLDRTVTEIEFEKVVAGLYPIAENATESTKTRMGDQRHQLSSLYLHGDTTETIRGTAWGVLNAYTEIVDWRYGRFDTLEARVAAQTLPGTSIDKRRQTGAATIRKVLQMA